LYGITSSSDGTKLAAFHSSGNTGQISGIWTSTDSGATWTEVTSIGGAKSWYGITSSSDGTKLAASVWGGNIWTSADSGATWTEDTSNGGMKNWHAITLSGDGTTLAATVMNGNIWTYHTLPTCTSCQAKLKKLGLFVDEECKLLEAEVVS
jgi:photosystem II stability/assembly factor-like uncharacterized protein